MPVTNADDSSDEASDDTDLEPEKRRQREEEELDRQLEEGLLEQEARLCIAAACFLKHWPGHNKGNFSRYK